jgi:hypothetical protein
MVVNVIKITLLVMASAGYGLPFSWDDPPVAEDGSMSVQQAISIVSGRSSIGVILPKWAWNIPMQR